MTDKKKPYDKDTINLFPDFYPKFLRWAVDQDYLDRLGPKEKAWLSKFLTEYYKASAKKGDPDALHNTDELRRKTYQTSNAMRRDLYTILEFTGKLGPLNENDSYDIEDRLNDALDTLYTSRLRVVRKGDVE